MLSLDNDLMKRKVFRAVAILAGILGVALVIFRADDPVNSVALPLTSMQRPVGDGFQPITPMQGVIAFAITAASFGLVTLLDHLVLNPKGH